MKYFLSTLFLLSLFVKAQNVPNGDFENWISYGNFSTPVSWHSTDSASQAQPAVGQHSVTQETANVHSGASAMKLQTWVYNYYGTYLNEPAAATNGNLNIQTMQFEAGSADTTRHDLLTGWYNYQPATGDTMSVHVALTKWNGASRDTVAEGVFSSGATTTAYSQFTVQLIYRSAYQSAGNPDTMLIVIVSGNIGLNTAHPGTVLYIDDLNFTGISGVNVLQKNVVAIHVYPNPAVDKITVAMSELPDRNSSAYILDIHGRQVKTVTITERSKDIDVSTLTNGNYFYELRNAKGEKLSTGQFTIKH